MSREHCVYICGRRVFLFTDRSGYLVAPIHFYFPEEFTEFPWARFPEELFVSDRPVHFHIFSHWGNIRSMSGKEVCQESQRLVRIMQSQHYSKLRLLRARAEGYQDLRDSLRVRDDVRLLYLFLDKARSVYSVTMVGSGRRTVYIANRGKSVIEGEGWYYCAIPSTPSLYYPRMQNPESRYLRKEYYLYGVTVLLREYDIHKEVATLQRLFDEESLQDTESSAHAA